MRKKASTHPTDSPECCQLLLENGADPNSVDKYKVSPLGTACGTGGARCIDLLVKYGADINWQDVDGATPLHQCFFRGNLDCLQKLMTYGPDAGLKHFKSEIVAIDGVFRDDMSEVLDFVLNDKDMRELIGDNPHLTVTQANIARFLH